MPGLPWRRWPPELDQLGELAWLVRMSHCVADDGGGYAVATVRLLGSALADVLLLRRAEIVRRHHATLRAAS